ncbi:hypothetical protein POM88_002291 [Heracleum sosnowskyi]|uniref:non-specific serine/threonine protein kinase n=1 Tax=Heracleum sosnowskyi TaxID=360622 RepID=A0AAD8JHD9_9APIA|nr:hypothetical protein POM88_002291 [Heracleum sosnowskyi]
MKELDESIVYGYMSIYPHPFDPELGEYQYLYNHDDLTTFSKRALEKYNQDKHKRYQFVELGEGFLHSSHVCDSITAYFNACQPGDMNVTFLETIDVPPGILSLPKHDPEITHVLNWTNSVRFSVLLTPTHLAIVMEYASGWELFDRICTAGRFSEHEAKYFFQQLISGVSFCHAMQICHRDLKLENTLLRWHMCLKTLKVAFLRSPEEEDQLGVEDTFCTDIPELRNTVDGKMNTSMLIPFSITH